MWEGVVLEPWIAELRTRPRGTRDWRPPARNCVSWESYQLPCNSFILFLKDLSLFLKKEEEEEEGGKKEGGEITEKKPGTQKS